MHPPIPRQTDKDEGMGSALSSRFTQTAGESLYKERWRGGAGLGAALLVGLDLLLARLLGFLALLHLLPHRLQTPRLASLYMRKNV